MVEVSGGGERIMMEFSGGHERIVRKVSRCMLRFFLCEGL